MSQEHKFNDGGPAFPGSPCNPGVEFDRGMSLRDYFAGMALKGWLANPALYDGEQVNLIEISDYAYRAADCMLKERDKRRATGQD